MAATIPALTRPRDNLYVLFLLSYILTILFFDAVPLYPPHLVPSALASPHAWYLATFKDPLILTRPPWFQFFCLSEFLYQLPISVYLVSALRKGSSAAPANMLVWAVVTGGTTVTCVYEFWQREMGAWERNMLTGMYGVYAVIFAAMGLDMFLRIQKTLKAATEGGEKKRQ